MYQINREANNITELKECLFGELGFKERDNLQEWIAKNPDVLGEELLIIQKEYDGFNDTNERLDLLALDKEANLVIIENKLDDTGRDVVWQALKYTSYCSTLTTTQIIKMYQEYLDKYEQQEDEAKTLILEFLEIEEDTLLLNPKNQDQRMIFVANNYRKEVTSTVLWLLKHDIQIQCFKATPYSMNEELFLQIEQIIPQPEMKEFMIDANEKEKEDKGRSKIVEQTRADLLEFWKLTKDDLQKHNIHHFDNISTKPHFYLNFSKGKAKYGMVIGRNAPRIEIYFSKDEDKKMFDTMQKHKEELESSFHGEITWQRLDTKKASRIKYDMPKEVHNKVGAWRDADSIKGRIEWYREELANFYKAFQPVWEKVQRELD